MISFLFSVMAFILLLIPLVVFHELGHFLFAKLFGVKAEAFSVGFGPVLWSKKLGETDFRVSAIPMGGYVKLLGEDRQSPLTEEEKKRALYYQKPWKRFFIVFGGPLFNFILSFFIFMLILILGEPHMASQVGRVIEGSPAYQAGFRNGDTILSVNGKSVTRYEEVAIALNESPQHEMVFSVMHDGIPSSQTPSLIHIKTVAQQGFSMYGENRLVGEIPGLFFNERSNLIGISNPYSKAGKLGLKTGDRIIALNGEAIKSWEVLESKYSEIKNLEKFELQIQKGSSLASKLSATDEKVILSLEKNSSQSFEKEWEIYSTELFIDKVVASSPAEKAGLKKGDRLISVGQDHVTSFIELKKLVQTFGEKDGKVAISWEREGKVLTQVIIPTATEARDPILNKYTQFTVGLVPMLEMVEPKMIIERVWNPIKLIPTAAHRMTEFIWRNIVSLKKMIVGDVSMGSIGGPLMIGKIAGESLSRGFVIFLTNMAVFSIGLGVLNILPIPVLDGGHLVLLGIESIRGKPLTLKQMEIIQGVGLVLILALMGVAFHNDISRFFYS